MNVVIAYWLPRPLLALLWVESQLKLFQ